MLIVAEIKFCKFKITSTDVAIKIENVFTHIHICVKQFTLYNGGSVEPHL